LKGGEIMANMIDMSSVTYGRSAGGMQRLLTSFQSDIDKTISYLSGSEYQAMVNSVAKYWIGVDADKFLKELQAMLNSDAALFKTYKSVVQSALNDDSKYFDRTQANIANTIKGVQ